MVCTQKDNTTVKIIDFGTAKELEPGTAIKVLCGTPEFVAPEVIFVQIVLKTDKVYFSSNYISQVVRYDFISTGSGEKCQRSKF